MLWLYKFREHHWLANVSAHVIRDFPLTLTPHTVAMFSEPAQEQTTLDQPDLGGGVSVGGGLGLNEAFTPELREKMVKLEKENEILKRRLENSGADSPLGKDH